MKNQDKSPPACRDDNADDWYDQHIDAWLDYQRTLSEQKPAAQSAQ